LLAGNGRLLAGVSQRRRARFRPFSSLPKTALFLASPNAKKGEKWDAKIRTFDVFARHLKVMLLLYHNTTLYFVEVFVFWEVFWKTFLINHNPKPDKAEK
jgi:hypothetical protein